MAFRCLLVVCITLLGSMYSSAKDWRGIIPLSSSRIDVERIIGPPKSQGKLVSSYEFDIEFVDVYYASGPPCGSGLTNEWKVPRDIVVSVRVIPKKEANLGALVNDISKYRKTTDPTDTRLVYYFSEEEGIRYTVREDARSSLQDVISVDYLPEGSKYHLKCSTAMSPVASLGLAPFERYSNVSAGRQKAIFDNFAIQLDEEKQLTGLVIIYSGSHKRASRTAQWIHNYLVNVRGVEPDRLVIKRAKRGNELSVELYLVPRDRKVH